MTDLSAYSLVWVRYWPAWAFHDATTFDRHKHRRTACGKGTLSMATLYLHEARSRGWRPCKRCFPDGVAS